MAESITSRSLRVRDLDIHFLEVGEKSLPLILLLHGFPELAFSWRKVMLPLASAGYHVVAPDQRGYGQTTPANSGGKIVEYDDDLSPFRMFNLVHDIVALTSALGYTEVAAVVGHDFGSPVAGFCAIIRPDMFKSVVMMSAPVTGAPPLPFAIESNSTGGTGASGRTWPAIDEKLAALNPPLKHYTTYFSTSQANEDMTKPPQGLRAFLRDYFHMKSGDWPINNPIPLQDATQIVLLPEYYIMPLNSSMPEVVLKNFPPEETTRACEWLPDAELEEYVEVFERTGFQGGLNWYRCTKSPRWMGDMTIFSGKKIDVPAMYLAGAKDWGIYQNPGASDVMRKTTCTKMAEEDFVLIPGAGHWVQQEKPDEVVKYLGGFLQKVKNESLGL